MEKKLKATLEKALNQLLQNTLEKVYYKHMDQDFLNLISSKEDFLFGVVVGDMLEGLDFCTYGTHKRNPKVKEFKQLFKMIQERSEEIQKRIKAIL